MNPVDHIVALRSESQRMAMGAEGQLDRTVPSCPGWQVADLVWHVGIVHTFWRLVATDALSGPDAWTEPDRPGTDDLLPWFRDGVDLTADTLDGLDPDTPAWTWGHRKTVGFIRRRVAQETAVHCWDARTAIGADEPIGQPLAVDGIDEFVGEVLPGLSTDLAGPAQTIRLQVSDSAEQWIVRAGDGTAALTRGDDQADAVVTGTASDLLLLLWGRCSLDRVELDGDVAALQRFLDRCTF